MITRVHMIIHHQQTSKTTQENNCQSVQTSSDVLVVSEAKEEREVTRL